MVVHHSSAVYGLRADVLDAVPFQGYWLLFERSGYLKTRNQIKTSASTATQPYSRLSHLLVLSHYRPHISTWTP